MYVPQLHQYTKKVVSPLAGDSLMAPAAIAAGTPVARYLAMSDGMKQSRLVREETIEFEGEPRQCYVIEAEYQHPVSSESEALPTTFWVEKTRHIVLRESTLVKLNNSPAGGPMTMNQVTGFEVALVNQPIADSLFTFRPPNDATEVSEIAMPGIQEPESEMVGKAAPAFTLKNLAGKPTALSAWKGRVVLLDFWATWCGPCRMELPTISKLHRELGPKGLVVIGVNVGETAGVASGFLKKNGYGFAVLLDSDSDLSQQYGANGLPTVVIIDRAGNISSHFIGVRSEDVLREAVRKAGIE
jgi:thiol-disulfide isomerase/thioredoxin